MTVIADGGRKAGWRGRLVWIALALSLTLNLFFFGGLVWMHMRGPMPPGMRVQRLLRPLDLNATQQQTLDQFLRTLRLRGRYMRENDQALIEDLWTEIAKPTPDDSVIAKLSAQVGENRQTFQRESSTALSAFIKSLTPEQRERLAIIAKSPPDEMARRLFDFVLPR
jgi:Spy/CpxP family protein refolding chaperone